LQILVSVYHRMSCFHKRIVYNIKKMSINNLYTGEIGERLAESLLLRFLTVAKPIPDTGIDNAGFMQDWFLKEIGKPVTFKVQVKTGKSFRVDFKVFNRWLELFEKESIILMHVEIISVSNQIFRCKSLHEWLLDNPNCTSETKKKQINFKINNFIKINDDGENFKKILVEEANRILKKKSIWRINNNLQLPLNEIDIFRNLGNLRKFEIPINLKNELTKSTNNIINIDISSNEEDIRNEIRNIWINHPKYQKDLGKGNLFLWLNEVTKLIDKDTYLKEYNEFKRFVLSMRTFSLKTFSLKKKPFWFPNFNYLEVSCWRIFVQMYPESIKLIEFVISNPWYWDNDQILAAFLLLSTLSQDSDNYFSSNTVDILNSVSNHYHSKTANDYNQFQITCEYTFVLAEAIGDKTLVKNHIDFVNKNPIDWMLKLNQDYYGDKTNNTLKRATFMKIKNPKLRDEKTKEISEFMQNRISNID
jgi:hypothetical protein